MSTLTDVLDVLGHTCVSLGTLRAWIWWTREKVVSDTIPEMPRKVPTSMQRLEAELTRHNNIVPNPEWCAKHKRFYCPCFDNKCENRKHHLVDEGECAYSSLNQQCIWCDRRSATCCEFHRRGGNPSSACKSYHVLIAT